MPFLNKVKKRLPVVMQIVMQLTHLLQIVHHIEDSWP